MTSTFSWCKQYFNNCIRLNAIASLEFFHSCQRVSVKRSPNKKFECHGRYSKWIDSLKYMKGIIIRVQNMSHFLILSLFHIQNFCNAAIIDWQLILKAVTNVWSNKDSMRLQSKEELRCFIDGLIFLNLSYTFVW